MTNNDTTPNDDLRELVEDMRRIAEKERGWDNTHIAATDEFWADELEELIEE